MASLLLVHTHPELFQTIVSKFPPLTPDRLKYAISEFWLSTKTGPYSLLRQLLHPCLTALNYFFVQTPPDHSCSQPVQIRYADAIRRFREVHYDRGNIVNAMDIEAKEMADCKNATTRSANRSFSEAKWPPISSHNSASSLLEIVILLKNFAVRFVAALFTCSLQKTLRI